MSETYLPLILVSASDLANASRLISEIVDNEVPDSDRRHRKGRVWRLVNKYYTADVEVCAAPDAQPLPPALGRLEAHVIYVTDAEVADEAEARRAALAAAGAGDAAVRLLVSDGERGALGAWARRRGYERVALRAGGDAHEAGAGRVRAALHAHAWRGLRRLDVPSTPAPESFAWNSSGSEPESDEEAAVERAEAFAAALAAAGAARSGAARSGAAHGGAQADAERRRRAERAVAALCRALGADLAL